MPSEPTQNQKQTNPAESGLEPNKNPTVTPVEARLDHIESMLAEILDILKPKPKPPGQLHVGKVTGI